MAKRKDPSPLFEIIHNAGQPSEPNVRIPEWLRKQQEERARQTGRPAPEPPEQQQPSELDAPAPQRPADRTEPETEPQDPPTHTPAAGGGTPSTHEVEADGEPVEPQQCSASSIDAADAPAPGADHGGGYTAWLSRPIVLRLGRGRAVALAVVGVLLLVGVFALGWQAGRSTALSRQQSYQNLVQGVQDGAESAEKGLIPSSVRGVEQQTAGAGSSAMLDPGNDPREAGLNYFRLVTLPDNARESGQRAVRFLRRNGVDAALVPTNNNNSLKLVALQGFQNPHSDPAAQRFKQRLQRLGREWKSQHRGSSDWEDMIPEKYRPGVN